ncbi:ABC transporter substrate-binding protein [Thalassobacillus hwangdonensis]|uniref:ABC transporter substrate-binding protein n=1 Tax=Thalassobacillus hwangdonensis TaxID=546108 RepID=A0ABW3KZL3_9BACI
MKKSILTLVISSFALLLSACGGASDSSNEDWKNQSWEETVSSAENTKVYLYMWGGDEGINQYIDEWAVPELEAQYNIELERVPMNTEEILQKLVTEKRADKQEGTIDIIWINGENFKNAKENGLLAGPFVERLPNFNDYYDTDSPALTTDFGTYVEGMEAPWGKVQFVFHYDSAKMDTPPASFNELKQWIKENPGEFTYPNPDDFTGNAFLRHILYANAEQPADIYDQPLEDTKDTDAFQETWSYLKEIAPDLWRKGEHYPNSLTELDRLYSQGEVWMTMGYNEARAESLIEQGIFPETTEAFVMEPGSIGNTHFLAIPFNSPNKAGAMAAINFFLSPEAQTAKLKPEYWGENTPLSIDKLNDQQREELENIDRGESVLSSERLEESFLPETSSDYVPYLKEQWFREIVEK